MMLFSKGRIPSLAHSEYQPSNKDEPEPLSKQLLSNSMRLKQAPGVTEFSHLPREISKYAFLQREVPPASSMACGQKPREDDLPQAKCYAELPSEPSHEGQRGNWPLPPPRHGFKPLYLPCRYVTSLHLSFHICNTAATPTSQHC